MDFSAKTVLVTGAAGGLGKAIAEAYLKAGARVSVCDINESRVQQTADEFQASYGADRFLATVTDITDEASVEHVFAQTLEKFGRLDVLVNNAGIADKFDPVGDVERSLWDRVLAINLTAPFLFSKLAVNRFQAQGEPAGGVIVNIASAASLKTCIAGAAYTASKHGLLGLTKNTAAMYADKHIRAVAILPGGMQTNIADAMAAGLNADGFARAKTQMGVAPMADVADVAQTVLFYSSPAAKSSNGAVVTVDGGWLAF
ncbi:Short-chain dehydrogenase/reductase SDR [Macrophomina phaseolina MS6]|uniref:Short-chain dehydrogenase/reductase SDR n=1 Tax=Macrophomina phaseolina (strain MS6) TaxID=1126212 RepID=K2S7V1_MACPH|nr:Short-chain dehydrogenase/reductase SDR [Macrophomina phaseolina MS6]